MPKKFPWEKAKQTRQTRKPANPQEEKERNAMKVTINKGCYQSVEISSGIDAPFLETELSLVQAYDLLRALEAKRDELHDLATNYYDCPDCAQTHHKSVTVCPSIGQEDEEE